MGFHRRMGRWVSSLGMLESTSETMGNRMERLGNSAESWVNSWGLLASKKGSPGCSWGMLANSSGMSENRTVTLENRKYWMVNRKGWLGNKPAKSVNNWETWVSTDWWGNMRERLESMLDWKHHTFAMESSVATLGNSLEM